MNLKDIVEDKLKSDIRWRERKQRLYCIAEFLIARYHLTATPTTLADALSEAESVNRYIRMLQSENEAYRGFDYSDGKVLAQNYQIKQLEYEPQTFKRDLQRKLL